MEARRRPSAALSAVGSTGAVVVALLLIFLALLGTWNEIRYQGCVSRIDQLQLIAVTQDAQNPAPVTLDCSRVPFK